MSLTLSQIAAYLTASPEGIATRVVGDADHAIDCVASLRSADARAITFFNDPKLKADLDQCQAGAVIITGADVDAYNGNRVVVDNPLLAFAVISEHLSSRSERNAGIHPLATVDASAVVAETAIIAPNVVIGASTRIDEGVRIGAGTVIGDNCHIGRDSVIDARVVIYDDCHFGERCRVTAGAVIGGNGFGYVHVNSKWRAVPQLAGVRVGCDVDIGANTTIDCGALDHTVICDRVKIDNLVHIGHNCYVGADTIIAGCAGLSGSARIGERCMLGGRVAIKDHVTIADDVVIEGMTFIAKSVPSAGRFSSIVTAQEAKKWKRNAARLHRLDDLARRLLAIERKIDD